MPSSTFDASTPAFAHTKPCRVSEMIMSPTRRSTAADSSRRVLASILRRDDPALSLRHDLLRDDEDVTVGSSRSPRCRGDVFGEVIARLAPLGRPRSG